MKSNKSVEYFHLSCLHRDDKQSTPDMWRSTASVSTLRRVVNNRVERDLTVEKGGLGEEVLRHRGGENQFSYREMLPYEDT